MHPPRSDKKWSVLLHRYVADSFHAGAVGAIVDRIHYEKPEFHLTQSAERFRAALLVVDDTLHALQTAARFYLEHFPRLLRIGITGSSGKTTTKEIAASIISQEKSVVTNLGNLNSETGLPLSVFAVRPEHEVGIFEMGMNRPGEIGELTRILRPQIALITGIGSAHIGLIGSRDRIAGEKKAVFSLFSGTETALIPEHDDYAAFLADGIKGKLRFFENFMDPQDRGLAGSEFNIEGIPVHFPLPGPHNVQNAAAAVAIAREIPVTSESIRKGLESVQTLFGRNEIIPGPVTVIRDCYNANPESTAAAIAWCNSVEWPGRKIYVIGSMMELGGESAGAHEKIGRILADSPVDYVFLFGAETEPAAKMLEKAGHPPFFWTNKQEIVKNRLQLYVQPDDLVLLKGSRSCKLEDLACF
ncbi:UDP-N-acetylmuramoyl-tripeptide--D-alanyl-D-alanine ligase [Spirochaetia bacterium]|nr:UDP-N-acetylmuramoyl-tripeptide--D-alanyl-D-alanine ligase [Spirochaetia bacterium]